MDARRRALVQFLPLALLSPISLTRLAAQEIPGPPLPDRATFQSGDLLWPKKPGEYVPYHSTQIAAAPPSEEKRWLAERDAAVARLRQDRGYFSDRDIDDLRTLSFREFYARYAGDQRPGVPGSYASGGGVYVGHVGIVEIDDSRRPWVIEAILEPGVVRTPYDDWLKSRPSEIVWHGRVRQLDASKRAAIAAEARKYVGKPYNFWNLNLDDPSGFYCSKLVWLSIWRSLSFPIDGDPAPKRRFWFSPKQLLYLPTVARLHDPGAYATR